MFAPIKAVGPFPRFTRGEYIADLSVHVAGLALAAIGAPLLVVLGFLSGSPAVIVSLQLYVVGLVAMFAFSALYNITQRGRIKELWRRCDQAAIFVMIAGSYSPFALAEIGGPWGIGLFAAVWTLAAVGSAGVFVFARRFEPFMAVGCLMMGWIILIAVGPLSEAVTTRVLILLAIGGVVYSVGVIFHLWEKLPYQNAIWHGFVLTAAALHYVAVFDATIVSRA